MLIIADGTKNKYVHNRTEVFPWFCRVIWPVHSTVCQFGPSIVIRLGTVILKLEKPNTHSCLWAAQEFGPNPLFCVAIVQKSCNKLFFRLFCLHGALFLSNKSNRQKKTTFYNKISFFCPFTKLSTSSCLRPDNLVASFPLINTTNFLQSNQFVMVKSVSFTQSCQFQIMPSSVPACRYYS